MSLALVPTGSTCSRIWHRPRFMAKKRGSVVKMHCYVNITGISSSSVTWFRKQSMDQNTAEELSQESSHILLFHNGSDHTLTIQGIQFEDNGIYFCQHNCTNEPVFQGCGTELRVMGVCWVDRVFTSPASHTHPSPAHTREEQPLMEVSRP